MAGVVNIRITISRIGVKEPPFRFTCKKRISIGEIKEKIFGAWEMPTHEQVIIFRGQKVSEDDRAQPLNTPDLAEIVEEAGENGLHMGVFHKPRKLPGFLEKEGLDGVNSKRTTLATALHRATRQSELTVMEELLADQDFAQADARDNGEQTALHVAVATWNRPACQMLLRTTKFSAAHARDAEGRTALHLAAHWGDAEVVRLICAHWRFKPEDAFAKDDLGFTAREYAVDCGHEEAAELIAQACTELPSASSSPAAGRSKTKGSL